MGEATDKEKKLLACLDKMQVSGLASMLLVLVILSKTTAFSWSLTAFLKLMGARLPHAIGGDSATSQSHSCFWEEGEGHGISQGSRSEDRVCIPFFVAATSRADNAVTLFASTSWHLGGGQRSAC
jgi:hypothetical protein